VNISTRRFADTVVLGAAGRVDHRSAGELEAALTAAAPGSGAVLLDFSGVEYISSVGLRVLMVAAREHRARQTGFAIAGLQPVVAEIFAISRFDKVLPVHGDVAAALAQLSASALAAWKADGSVP
jgi:anti-anti-sigma factor